RSRSGAFAPHSIYRSQPLRSLSSHRHRMQKLVEPRHQKHTHPPPLQSTFLSSMLQNRRSPCDCANSGLPSAGYWGGMVIFAVVWLKWQRIMFVCWRDRVPYNETTYLQTLKHRGSHLTRKLDQELLKVA